MKKWLRPKFILTLVALTLLFSCMWSWTWAYFNGYSCFNSIAPPHENVETSGYFKFPPSTQNIEFHASTKHKAACVIWVKFELDSTDSSTFIKSTFIENVSPYTQINDDGLTFFSELPGWIQPKSLLRGTMELPGNATHKTSEGIQILYIDTTAPDKHKIYLITIKL